MGSDGYEKFLARAGRAIFVCLVVVRLICQRGGRREVASRAREAGMEAVVSGQRDQGVAGSARGGARSQQADTESIISSENT